MKCVDVDLQVNLYNDYERRPLSCAPCVCVCDCVCVCVCVCVCACLCAVNGHGKCFANKCGCLILWR